MGTNPYQGQNSDPSNQYGGYTGYNPSSPQDDPYGAGQQGSQADYQYGQQQQQYTYGQQTYQPPLSASQGSSGANEPTSTGMDGKNAAVLSYVLWFLSGLVFFFIERKNRFVRFHAAQSFIFFGAVSAVYIVLRLITIIPLLGFLLAPVVSCATWVLLVPAVLIWLFLMMQAYRGVKFKLPVVGDYAEGLVARFTKTKRTP